MEVYWRAIKGFDNYMIGFNGDVKSLKRKGVTEDRLVTPYISSNEFYVYLYDKGGKKHSLCVKNLVASAFLDYDSDLSEVVKVVKSPENNSVTNLRVVYTVEGTASLVNTPIDVLMNFSTTYLSKSYGLSKAIVTRVMTKKLDGYSEHIKTLTNADKFKPMDEFDLYHITNSFKIDNAWMGSEERKFLKNNLHK